MPRTSRHSGFAVVLFGLFFIGIVIGYIFIYEADVHSHTREKLSLKRIDKLMIFKQQAKENQDENVIDGSNENTDAESVKKMSVLENENAQLEEKIVELQEIMEERNNKSEARIEKLLRNRKKTQATIYKLENYPGKKEEELKDKIEKLKAELKTLNDTSAEDDGSEVAADEDLDPETLTWKKLLFTPRNASFIENRTKVDNKTLDLFKKRVFSQRNLDFVFGAFDVWVEIATEEKIPWFLAYGSLLGSYRHHGFIPWDGDIDVLMDERYKEIFLQAFKRKHYTDYDINHSRPWAKIHPKNGTKPSHWPWKTPFVDVFYWKQNDTHLWSRGHRPKLKTDVFPLQKRPFQGRMVLGPRDPRSVLLRSYGRNISKSFIAELECKGGIRDYLTERYMKDQTPTVPCAQLLHLYPFVRHVRGEGGAYCKEELVMKGKVLSVFYRNATGIPVC